MELELKNLFLRKIEREREMEVEEERKRLDSKSIKQRNNSGNKDLLKQNKKKYT